MLDFDMAELYGTETKKLNQAVRRNIIRFPDDFMFRLSITKWETMRSQFVTSNAEMETMRSQIVTASQNKRNNSLTPYAFTEQGIAMLSGVLNSEKAIEVNIAIMRAFAFIRQYALTHKDLTEKLRELENKYDTQFSDVYQVLNCLLVKDKQDIDQKQRKQIGY